MYNVGKPTDKVTKISVIEFKKYLKIKYRYE